MTKEQSEKYLEIVKNGNMDDMFDFGRQSLLQSIEAKIPAEKEVARIARRGEFETVDMAEIKGFNECRTEIIKVLNSFKENE